MFVALITFEIQLITWTFFSYWDVHCSLKLGCVIGNWLITTGNAIKKTFQAKEQGSHLLAPINSAPARYHLHLHCIAATIS